MTISNMIEYYTVEGNQRRINNLCNEFGVSERRVWAVQVRTFVASNQWEQLYKLATSKKTSPIGFEVCDRMAACL